MKLTEKEIKKLCKKAGCHCPPYHEILGKYADTPEYLRQYIEGIGKKEIQEKLKKIIKWFEKEMHKSIKESRDFNKKGNEVMEQHSLGIAAGFALSIQKLKRL